MKERVNYHFVIAELFFLAGSWFFLYHGILALTLPEGFLSLFGVVGITGAGAQALLIVVGVIDILVGFSLVFHRYKVSLVYSTIWPLIPAIIATVIIPHDAVHNFVEHLIPVVLVVMGIVVSVANKDDRKQKLLFQKTSGGLRKFLAVAFAGTLILAVLLVWKKERVVSSVEFVQRCPDTHIITSRVSLQAHVNNPHKTSDEYYVFQGKRVRVDDADVAWIKENCRVPKIYEE